MSAERDKVIGFPVAKEITEEEKARRVMVEATRLANLAPGEWRLWIDGSAERLGIPRDRLEATVLDIIRAKEKKAREDAAERRRIEVRAEKQRLTAQRRIEKDAERQAKEKIKAFAAIIKLPSGQREAQLIALANRLGEDLDTVRDEFTDLVGADAHADPGYVEPWPEPVETQALLSELVAQLRRYVVVHDEGAIAVTLWVMMAWLHAEIATHSPILVITSAEQDSGKTTSLGVLGLLTPRPHSAIEVTGPGLFHIVDQWHPTLIVDEADKLFPRKIDLRHIVNASWTRGAKVPRHVRGVLREFDLFCPKIIGMKGLDLPPTTASRAIVVELFPKLPDEPVEDFKYADDDAFVTLRRKLARWSMDHAGVLKDATPAMPSGFGNRLAQNWRLLFAIADLAGDVFAKQARAAAVKLCRKTVKKSEGVRLLEALRRMFAECAETPTGMLMSHFDITEAVTSETIVTLLKLDPEDEWAEFRGRHSGITQRELAALLAAYDIRPDVLHPTKRSSLSRRGYKREQFEEAFKQFLPSDPNIRTPKE